jgi:adenosylcobinamide-GDP ribazoletransferase
MRGLILAIQFLTRLPTPRLTNFRPEELACGVVWFPLVGALLGGFVAAAAWLGGQVDPWLGALLALAAWVGGTGALHLDGLADLADALGAAHRPEDAQARKDHLLAVLADPHMGVFGGVALAMQLIAKLVLLMLVVKAGAYLVLVLVPAWARWGVLAWSRLPPVKTGLGERFAWRVGRWPLLAWGAVLAGASLMAPALFVAPPLVAAWRVFLLRRLGGMTGDALGAGVEWLESGLLLALVLGVAFGASSRCCFPAFLA